MNEYNLDGSIISEEEKSTQRSSVGIQELLNKYKNMRAEQQDDSSEDGDVAVIPPVEKYQQFDLKDQHSDYEIPMDMKDEPEEFIITQQQSNPVEFNTQIYEGFNSQLFEPEKREKPKQPDVSKQLNRAKTRKFSFKFTDISGHAIKYEQITYQISSYLSSGLNDDDMDKDIAQRQYSDFEWMQNVLIENFPGVIIPSIPPKTIFAKLHITGFTQSIRAQRQKGLEEFLNKVLDHPKLKNCEIVEKFFILSDIEFKKLCQDYNNSKSYDQQVFIQTLTTSGILSEALTTNISKGIFAVKNYIFGETKENIKDKLQNVEEFFIYVEKETKAQSIKLKKIKEIFNQLLVKVNDQFKYYQGIASVFQDFECSVITNSQEMSSICDQEAQLLKEYSQKCTTDIIYVFDQLVLDLDMINEIIRRKQELQSLITSEANALSSNKIPEEQRQQVLNQLSTHQTTLSQLIENFKDEFNFFCDRFNSQMNYCILKIKKYDAQMDENIYQLWNFQQ